MNYDPEEIVLTGEFMGKTLGEAIDIVKYRIACGRKTYEKWILPYLEEEPKEPPFPAPVPIRPNTSNLIRNGGHPKKYYYTTNMIANLTKRSIKTIYSDISKKRLVLDDLESVVRYVSQYL